MRRDPPLEFPMGYPNPNPSLPPVHPPGPALGGPQEVGCATDREADRASVEAASPTRPASR